MPLFMQYIFLPPRPLTPFPSLPLPNAALLNLFTEPFDVRKKTRSPQTHAVIEFQFMTLVIKTSLKFGLFSLFFDVSSPSDATFFSKIRFIPLVCWPIRFPRSYPVVRVR